MLVMSLCFPRAPNIKPCLMKLKHKEQSPSPRPDYSLHSASLSGRWHCSGHPTNVYESPALCHVWLGAQLCKDLTLSHLEQPVITPMNRQRCKRTAEQVVAETGCRE